MRITPHFDSNEFAQPARHGFPRVAYPREWIGSLRQLCGQLEIIRAAIGAEIYVISGFREPDYNRVIGGARYSMHCEGRAADIVVKRVPAKTLHVTILRLRDEGRLPLIRGLGLYPQFVHVDTRPSDRLVRWSGGRTIA